MKTKLKSKSRIPATNGTSIVSIATPADPVPALRLDLGCGPNHKPGFVGVDSIAFPGVDVVTDLRKTWPWKDNTVDEVHMSHCLEHFDAIERVHVYNEMWRVMKPGAKAQIICPYWSSGRAYGDPTHKWPPISTFSFFYILKSWRMANAPHTDFSNWPLGFKCDFDASGGFNLHPKVAERDQAYIEYAMTFYMEACQDVFMTLTARK